LAQLIEFKPRYVNPGTAVHVVPELVLVSAAGPAALEEAPPAKQTVVPLGHDTDSITANWLETEEPDCDQEVPPEMVDMAVAGPTSDSSPPATHVDTDEHEIASRS
jgi:hypothetical protein